VVVAGFQAQAEAMDVGISCRWSVSNRWLKPVAAAALKSAGLMAAGVSVAGWQRWEFTRARKLNWFAPQTAPVVWCDLTVQLLV